MKLEDALKWADTFGPIQSDPPTGDGPALMALAAEVRRLSSQTQTVTGRCVEIGDDDDGQPMMLIHTTREEIMKFGRNLAFADVSVRLKTDTHL